MPLCCWQPTFSARLHQGATASKKWHRDSCRPRCPRAISAVLLCDIWQYSSRKEPLSVFDTRSCIPASEGARPGSLQNDFSACVRESRPIDLHVPMTAVVTMYHAACSISWSAARGPRRRWSRWSRMPRPTPENRRLRNFNLPDTLS